MILDYTLSMKGLQRRSAIQVLKDSRVLKTLMISETSKLDE